jgi:hypothetical protein
MGLRGPAREESCRRDARSLGVDVRPWVSGRGVIAGRHVVGVAYSRACTTSLFHIGNYVESPSSCRSLLQLLHISIAQLVYKAQLSFIIDALCNYTQDRADRARLQERRVGPAHQAFGRADLRYNAIPWIHASISV